jgi:hypothetical protein
MERKIGEVFTYDGKTYQVVKSILCAHCAFRGKLCGLIGPSAGNCMPNSRSDNTSVIFKEIKDMEIKNNQLTIDIPEGMEIDLENSDLAKGIVKFKKKDITYKNIEDALSSENYAGAVINTSNGIKLEALNKLMNIAKYYNGDWKPDWSDSNEYKYSIIYNRNTYKVDHNWTSISSNIYFKNKDDAQYVIDNPNFRVILDTIYKN